MHYDVIVVGSGIVGAVCAVALAKYTPLQIALLEAEAPKVKWSEATYALRVSAISLASQRILQSINVWEPVQRKRVSPYTNMQIWDALDKGELHFDCRFLQNPQLGHIVEDNLLRESIHAQFSLYTNLHYYCPIQLLNLTKVAAGVELNTDRGTLSASLLVGADGAHSWVRQTCGIPLVTQDYGHTAFIAHVTTALPHQKTAWQRFLPTGPLAFLPLLNPNHCSIVWSAVPTLAGQLQSLTDIDFQKTLGQALEHRLGEVLAITPRQAFALHMRHAQHYMQRAIVLIGDAAHTIHPLAGQGANLGLLDAACLVEVILMALEKGREFASEPTLRRYARWRRADTLIMLTLVDWLKWGFANENKGIQKLRNIGLDAVNRLPLLKNYLANYALGKRDDLPRLAMERYDSERI